MLGFIILNQTGMYVSSLRHVTYSAELPQGHFIQTAAFHLPSEGTLIRKYFSCAHA
jgi:hypothetical protein